MSSEPTTNPTLVVRGLSRSYDGRKAVDQLDLEAMPGEIVGLVGPNGAGKTTTLRSVAGVLPIQAGSIHVAGFDVATEERESKRRLAWVPDDPKPFETLTVAEHLEFTAALYGLGSAASRRAELLERFELKDRADSLGSELSRGMRQKLAFCCAWLPQPDLYLLDEPLSGLDPRGIRSAKAAIREVAAQGAAVILSSHLLDLIEELASRLVILDTGRKLFDGTLEEARATLSSEGRGSRLEDLFLGITGGDVEVATGEVKEAP